MKLIIASILVGAIAINASSADAVVKTIKDIQGNAIISGLAPNSEVELKYPDKIIINEVRTNSCAYLLIPKKILNATQGFTYSERDGSNPIVFSYLIHTPAVPTIVPPDCFNGVSSRPSLKFEYNGLWKTAGKDFFISRGVEANKAYLITSTKENIRKVKANACGIVRLKSTAAYPVTGVIIVNNNYNNAFDAERLVVEPPPLCRNGVEYVAEDPNDVNPLVRINAAGDIIFGAAPNSIATVSVLYTNIKKTILSDSCGMVRAKNNPKSPFFGTVYVRDFNGNEVSSNYDNATVNEIPKCKNGTVIADIPTGFNFTSLSFNQDYYLIGLQPQTAYSVEYEGSITKEVKVNACGIGKVKSSGKFPIGGETRINDRQYNLSGMPTDETKAVCRGSVFYAPK